MQENPEQIRLVTSSTCTQAAVVVRIVSCAPTQSHHHFHFMFIASPNRHIDFGRFCCTTKVVNTIALQLSRSSSFYSLLIDSTSTAPAQPDQQQQQQQLSHYERHQWPLARRPHCSMFIFSLYYAVFTTSEFTTLRYECAESEFFRYALQSNESIDTTKLHI